MRRRQPWRWGKSLGGTVLFGQGGTFTALLSGSSAGDENACLQALEAAKNGVEPTRTKPVDDVKDTLEKATEGIGPVLKKLFGK